MRCSFRMAAVVVSLAAVIATALPWSAALPRQAVLADEPVTRANMDPSELLKRERRPSIAPNVEWQLSELVRSVHAEGLDIALHAAGAYAQDEKLRVVVDCIEEDASRVANFIEGNGAIIEATWRGLIQCLVAPNFVEELARVEGVRAVRLPPHSFPCVESQGVPLINADDWHGGNIDGAGVKVGILDGGFSGYADLLGSELPTSVATRWPLEGEEGTSVHGTACAELVHDVAPGASLYLARYSGYPDWNVAAQWLIDHGVDVISCSMGWLGTGPRDGTSPICEPIRAARNAGILWSQSAGNSAQQHWAGTWRDTNGNDLYDFGTPALPDESNAVWLYAGRYLYVDLNWDDTWGAAQNDYDLWVYYRDNTGTWFEIETSENDQASGAYPYPSEWVSFTAPQDGYYHIFVVKWSAARDCALELFVTASALQYQVPEGSITDNAASPDAMTIGAVDWAAPGEIEPFSSQGPTVDGRTKPDIVGPDGVATDTYAPDSFVGTSASTPHVAGTAALVKQAYPHYHADLIQAYLEANAVDLGGAGKDNTFGSGRLLLSAEPPPILDFGDAPDATYPTLLASNGARHVTVPGFYLGTAVDAEYDGQPSADATGDDLVDRNDDEDGVAFTSALAPGEQATVNVTASASGFLDAWLDFNGDGYWDDTGERIFDSEPLSAGCNELAFSVPGDMSVSGYAFSRFRFSSTGGLSCTGAAPDGEVEDYMRPVSTTAVDVDLFAGWNLVSVPVTPDEPTREALFPDAEAVYTWDLVTSSYAEISATGNLTTIEPGRGYWVAVSSPCVLLIEGDPVPDIVEYPLGRGWNTVGSVFGRPVDVDDMEDSPGGAVLRDANYTWEAVTRRFVLTSHVVPGKGYWMAASEGCLLSIPGPP